MNEVQVAWRERHVATAELGSQNGKRRRWILPRARWRDGLWPGIRRGTPNDLDAYLRHGRIQRHTGVHNLKSSWVLGANLYFAHRQDPALLAGFLAAKVNSWIAAVEKLELEWVADAPLDPGTLLGEVDGRRGAGQTSPDVAFFVRLDGGGRGLVLTEVKFTERFGGRPTAALVGFNDAPGAMGAAAPCGGDPARNRWWEVGHVAAARYETRETVSVTNKAASCSEMVSLAEWPWASPALLRRWCMKFTTAFSVRRYVLRVVGILAVGGRTEDP